MLTLYDKRKYPVNYKEASVGPGTLGFSRRPYWFHRYLPSYVRNALYSMGFVAKTMTLEALPGNMPLQEDGETPVERFPKCIYVTQRHGGNVLNAVGLANKGLQFYLERRVFDGLVTQPYMISILLRSNDKQAELREVCDLLQNERLKLLGLHAIQMNFGCPNTGHDPIEFANGACALIEEMHARLQVPIIANVNALMPTRVLIDMSHVAQALWIGNTIPFRAEGTEDVINWDGIFGDGPSPLQARVKMDGGLSGPDCLQLTLNAVETLRDSGVRIPIVGGNGIRRTDDIHWLKKAGCNAVAMSTIMLTRPWRLPRLVYEAKIAFAH